MRIALGCEDFESLAARVEKLAKPQPPTSLVEKMKMLPEEAINAATVNGAYAMELSGEAGSISKGKLANLIITKPMDSVAYMPYAFGTDWIDKVMIAGEV